MFGSTPEQQAAYKARRKAELDIDFIVAAARREGYLDGLLEAEKSAEQRAEERGYRLAMVTLVHFLQGMLKEAETPEAELMALDPISMDDLRLELQRRVEFSRKRHQVDTQ